MGCLPHITDILEYFLCIKIDTIPPYDLDKVDKVDDFRIIPIDIKKI